MAAPKLLLFPFCLLLVHPFLRASTTLTVNPTKDDFTNAGTPTLNYGAAGALNISGSGTAKGADDTFMTFDVSSIVNSFNSTFGVGGWSLTGASLLLTEKTNPNNAIFNNNVSGSFEIRWITNDSYAQGTGNLGAGTTDGITWNTEGSFLTPGTDVSLGTSFGYTSTASNTQESFLLPLVSPGFVNDLNAAGLVSFYLTAGSGTTAFTFNSTDFTSASARPVLSLTATAVPEPSRALPLLLGLSITLGWRRRRLKNP